MLFNNKRKNFEKKALKYIDSLFYLALKLTQKEDKASDLVQETYLKAFSNYKKYREDINLKAWLFRILTNTFINDYRKRKRESFVFDYDDNENVYYNWLDNSIKNQTITPDKQYFFTEIGEEIEKALDQIPEDFRMMILYADVYELSYKEIAEIIDAPMGTVMSKLYRARKMMQAKLYKQAEQLGILKDKHKNENKKGKVVKLAV